MFIKHTLSDGGVLTLMPLGRLDSNTAPDFQKSIEKNLTGDVKELVFDFQNVDYLSSAGLRTVISTYKKLGDIKFSIINVTDTVAEIFKISGLLDTFNIKFD